MTWTHKALVTRLAKWLKYTKRMTVVMAELHTKNSETPDVMGWIGNANSILIECKASRQDFLADKNKFFRRHEEMGMGDVRYIAAPEGLLVIQEIPEGWGLLEVSENHVIETIAPTLKKANKTNECVVLMSALRRLEISTAVYVVSEEEPLSKTGESNE
jgi:hypothetical protein